MDPSSQVLAERYSQDVTIRVPASEEAERGALCSFLLDPRLLDDTPLTKDHFYNAWNAVLYDLFRSHRLEGKPVDILSLSTSIRDKGLLASAGNNEWAVYLTSLQVAVPTAANLGHYTAVLQEKYLLRETIRACTDTLQDCYNKQDEVGVVVDQAVKRIMVISEARTLGGVDDPTEQTASYLELADELEYEYEHQGELLGISTGMRWMDQMTGGLQREALYLLGGRPSSGKSMLLSQMGVHTVRSKGKDGQYRKVLIFSMEMSSKRWRKRMFAQDGVMPAGSLSSGIFTERDFQKLHPHIGHMRDHLFVYARSGLSVNDIMAVSRKALSKHPDIAWIGVDYLQILKPNQTNKTKAKHEEIAEACQALNALKKELNLPIVVCAALNRESESRKENRPFLSDVAGSGQIEYDIDTGILLHMEPNGPEMTREGWLIMAKNRDGGLDDKKIYFSKKNLLFTEYLP